MQHCPAGRLQQGLAGLSARKARDVPDLSVQAEATPTKRDESRAEPANDHIVLQTFWTLLQLRRACSPLKLASAT